MTVTCDCEAVRLVAYGERWTCEGCGRKASFEEARDPQTLAPIIRIRTS